MIFHGVSVGFGRDSQQTHVDLLEKARGLANASPTSGVFGSCYYALLFLCFFDICFFLKKKIGLTTFFFLSSRLLKQISVSDLLF